VTTELGMSHPGPTTNPFDPRRTPGGSSSGSAAVIGAAMVPVAIGTQVGGSVIRPASFCANHALKPTFGALNRGERQGLSQSHVGVHAGCLGDMWSVAIEIARRAGGDPGHPGLFGPAALPPAAKPARLIVMETEGWTLLDSGTLQAFEQVLASLRKAGIEILTRRDDKLIEAFDQAIAESLAMTRDLCAYEMRWSLENLVEQHPGKQSPSLLARLALGRRLKLEDYRRVLLQREEARRCFAAIAPLGDALVSLASAGPAPLSGDTAGSDGAIVHTTGTPAFNAATSALGAPAVTVPLIAVGNLPVGVQVVGQPHMDARVAGIARWLAENVAAVSVP
jgi:Asp-tRNA(Asn)/Glu-tRNA(Gln) amidotransferase A subunit family amidase